MEKTVDWRNQLLDLLFNQVVASMTFADYRYFNELYTAGVDASGIDHEPLDAPF